MTDVTGSGLRQQKKERTRATIERVALEMFATRGFDETTIEEIAAAADVSARTFFRYFATKDDVLYADSDRRLDTLVGAIADRAASASPFAAVRDAVVSMIEEYQADTEALEIHTRVLARNRGAYTRSLERQHVWEEAVYLALQESTGGGAAGGTLELRLVAAAATAALRAATQSWEDAQVKHRQTEPLPVLVRYTFDRMGSGLGL